MWDSWEISPSGTKQTPLVLGFSKIVMIMWSPSISALEALHSFILKREVCYHLSKMPQNSVPSKLS